MVNWLTRVSVAAVLVLGSAAQSSASPVTFTFTGTDFLTAVGQSQAWSLSGITVTATAWYANGSGVGMARLAGYQNFGMGVCNVAEDDGTCGTTKQGIDNSGLYDFVLFSFNPAVDLQSVSLYPLNAGTDVSFWMGNGATTVSSSLLASLVNGGGMTVTLDNTNALYSSLLFGARVGESNDSFLIQSLTVNSGLSLLAPAVVPEPASLWLLGTGLFAAAALVRRGRRARKS
jgi:hypothetical protein